MVPKELQLEIDEEPDEAAKQSRSLPNVSLPIPSKCFVKFVITIMTMLVTNEEISLAQDERLSEETFEKVALEDAIIEKDVQPLIEEVILEPGPSSFDNQQREIKWGAPSVALNEIELGATLPPHRKHDRWWTSTAFKSGIAILAVVGIIAIVVGVAATQAKEVSSSATNKRDYGGNMVYNARAMSLFCDFDPPSNDKCVTSDWDKEARTEGTRVFYRCVTIPSRTIVRTVECDGFTWVDKFNNVADCPCDMKNKLATKTKTNVRPTPKPIRPTPTPKLVVPFSSIDYKVPNEADSDEDKITITNKINVNESPPLLPPTPPKYIDDENQSEDEDNLGLEETAGHNVNVDLDDFPKSEDNKKASRRGKIIYRLSPSHYRPIGWSFVKISVVGLCFSALIGIVFALLSTKHIFNLKTEMYKYASQNNSTDDRMALNSVNANICFKNPPEIRNCMIWDWDEETHAKGTVVIYQCSNNMQSLAMIVICDYGTTNWKVIKNITNNCSC
uniref:Uncharacterized protein n=1 Tax=Strigamia maritima TaxID=126957 RepID=T1J318_STRMM